MPREVRVAELIRDLNPRKFASYGPKPIPHPLDEVVAKLVRTFLASGTKARKTIINGLGSKHSSVLLAFAERMASLAVRRKDAPILREGLIAIVMEGFRGDLRENLLVLSLFDDAAQRIGLNRVTLFDDAAACADPDAADHFRQFVRREPGLRSIACMGYEESHDLDGFRYHRTW